MTSSGLGRPVRVEVPARAVRVAAVLPCFNRPGDLAALVGDLARCELMVGGGCDRGETPSLRSGLVEAGPAVPKLCIELSVVVVDNASQPPLEMPTLPEPITTRPLRLAANTGGSGGYSAGMAYALTELDAEPDYLWLVDSDARVEPGTLAALIDAMERDQTLVATGPVLCDLDGRVQEVGGEFERDTGCFRSLHRELPEGFDDSDILACDYVAACCALVRAEAVRRVGVFPDVFLNADDVEWCLRLAREWSPGPGASARIGVVCGTRASHPDFSRFSGLPRYFGARNAFGPIAAMGLGPRVRFRRAFIEVRRAVNQEIMARPDLAELHVRGLKDAAARRLRGRPADLPKTVPMRPLADLAAALREVGVAGGQSLVMEVPEDTPKSDREVIEHTLRACGIDPDSAATPVRGLPALARRCLFGPSFGVAVVPARSAIEHWLPGRAVVTIAWDGFASHRTRRWRQLLAGVWAAMRCAGPVVSLTLRGLSNPALPGVREAAALAPHSQRREDAAARAPGGTRLSVVVLSYNRKGELLETLARLGDSAATRDAEVIVVDNASTDGSPAAVREHAPWARVIELPENEAIGGFNRGVEAAAGECVLILDDDARPDDGAIDGAMALLADRPDLGAVTLVPYHPATGASEWSFAERCSEPTDAWPVMGCCNLVRRRVWRAVGGYDGSFFLYRNDTDLALKILAAGLGVHCNPRWRCEHDSPAAGAKTTRWCELATRNWVWLARRHGRGWARVTGILAGWVWAHRLAGWSAGRQWAVLRGVAAGIVRAPTEPGVAVRPDGRAFAALLRLRFTGR